MTNAGNLPRTAAPALSPEQILSQGEGHTFELESIDWRSPIDRSRLFICPTLTPLYYTPVYEQLRDEDRRRYNQLSALCFSEVIAFFEGALLSALYALMHSARLPPVLAECVEKFIGDERKHREMWRRLNVLTEPGWYANHERHIVRIGWPLRTALAWLAGRPERFPVVVWMMLTLEEHSMEISRRCGRLPADAIEPRYRAAYRLHMEEEIRHVHTDRHLLDYLLGGLSPRQRRTTAWQFGRAVDAFLLRPKRAAVRVIDVLLAERPALRPLRRSMDTQLYALRDHAPYTTMMFSTQTTPASWALWQQLAGVSAVAADG